MSPPRLSRRPHRDVVFRTYRDEYQAGVLHVIASVFREYGVTLDPFGYDADLTAIHRAYDGRGGSFMVMLAGCDVVGTVGVVPVDAVTCELRRLYIVPAYRGDGHGRILVEYVIGWAATRGHRTVRLWTDAKFTRSHSFYRSLGFRCVGERIADDLDRSHEFAFAYAIGAAAPTEAPVARVSV